MLNSFRDLFISLEKELENKIHNIVLYWTKWLLMKAGDIKEDGLHQLRDEIILKTVEGDESREKLLSSIDLFTDAIFNINSQLTG